MRTKQLWLVLCWLILGGTLSAQAAFKDIKLDLTNGNLLTTDEISSQTAVSFGVAIAGDGTATRVEAGDASAAIVLSGKFHSNDHGWSNFSATVAVDGPVKISMGTCAWGGNVKVADASGATVTTFNTNNGACFHNDKATNIASANYKGEATTLTISGGSYTPYIAVESLTTVPEDYTVTFSTGDTGAEGFAPAAVTVEAGSSTTIPANFSLYVEGKTLTGWIDGTTTYAIGDAIAPTANTTLTPVFTANTVSLGDRTEAVTLKWDFQSRNGAPKVAIEGSTGIWVTQAQVGDQTIDVKMDMDATTGKVNNNSWTDWCQWNNSTKFTIPSCVGAVVSLEAYSEFGRSGQTATTIDGQSDYTSAKTISYTVASKAETIDIVIGTDGSYYRYVQTVLPVVEQTGGKTYTNEEATVVWPFSDDTNYAAYTATPAEGFSMVNANIGDLDLRGTGTGNTKDEKGDAVKFVKLRPSGSSKAVEWLVKPAAGLTFTPTRVAAYILRFGTDAENGIVVTAKTANGEEVALGTFTAPRNNKSQADDKYGSNANYTERFDITLTEEQQQQLASSDGFYLYTTVGVGSAKEGGFSDVRIYGTLNGTAESVEKYTLTTTASPAEGGTVSVYPKASEFDAGTEVTLTATPNFGYHFANWTDATGTVVSTEAKFTYTMEANAELTANFTAVQTYSLTCDVTGGAKSYMVSFEPEPTEVDGKNMYEVGTKVTLTATGNDIITFSNWSDGQTAGAITMTMDADKAITANFSAKDFIAAWDFYLAGNNGRVADFANEGNEIDQLVLRDAEGNTYGWLDKCAANGGYEGKPAGVNWKNDQTLGYYYWQTKVDASNFTDIKVKSSMVYNYNAYQTYDVEYSLDDANWAKVGSITVQGAKNWQTEEFSLPAAANNQSTVYIRWIADKTSNIDGTTSNNDGNAIGGIYITGTEKLVDDGTAPKLVSTVPAEGATNASANGKVVLTFDEKVKLTDKAAATLGTQTLTGAVSGKTVAFEYKGLDYATPYTFTLAAGSVADLTDNATTEAITLRFTTMTKPVVTKQAYDFIVPDDGTVSEAIAAATKRTDTSKRFRIFIKQSDSNYVLTADENNKVTGSDDKQYADPKTYLTTPNVSFIGEDMDKVVITQDITTNTFTGQWGAANPLEGIGKSDVLQFSKNATGTYMQDLTVKSGIGDALGRNIVLNDQSNKTICKDVCLWGYQDTYVSNSSSSRFYFEGGVLRGRTDFLCGKGDVFYNAVELQMCANGYLAVPSVPTKYGYIFKDCKITGDASLDGNYTLGRPWGSGTPIALFIDTEMEIIPSAVGWNEMSGGWPARFAEYNSHNSKGTVIDLNGRKTTFGDGHTNNPVLTAEEAALYTIPTVMGGDDDWDPTAATEQASAPANVMLDKTAGTLTWENSDYVLLWAVCKDGKVVDFTLEPTYTVSDPSATWSVRAANEMGGLGDATEAQTATGISEIAGEEGVVSAVYYNLQGMRVGADAQGVVIRVTTMADGSQLTTKLMK